MDTLQNEGTNRAYCHLVKPEDTLLLVINLQEGLVACMERKYREIFLRNNRILIRTARALDIPVMATEQMPDLFGPILPEIDALLGDSPRIRKKSFSCWREGEIRAGIRNQSRTTVVVTGLEAHVCVLMTVMDLVSTGHHTLVATDAVCSRRAFSRESALNAMGHAGAAAYPTETIAFMLMEKAGTAICEEAMALMGWDASLSPGRARAMGRQES
jgi:nicotinamidase-related amidase